MTILMTKSKNINSKTSLIHISNYTHNTELPLNATGILNSLNYNQFIMKYIFRQLHSKDSITYSS